MATEAKKRTKTRRVVETQWAIVLWRNFPEPFFVVDPSGPCMAMTFASREAAQEHITGAFWPRGSKPTPVRVRISEIVPRKKKK